MQRNERGQGLVEYALILVLVAVVVIVILTVMGPQIGNIFSKVTSGLGVAGLGGGGGCEPSQGCVPPGYYVIQGMNTPCSGWGVIEVTGACYHQ